MDALGSFRAKSVRFLMFFYVNFAFTSAFAMVFWIGEDYKDIDNINAIEAFLQDFYDDSIPKIKMIKAQIFFIF